MIRFFDLGLESLFKSKRAIWWYERRVQIAKALIHDPEIIILDEPTAGVDIELRHLLWDSLREMNKNMIKHYYLQLIILKKQKTYVMKLPSLTMQNYCSSPKDLIANDGESLINITVDRWDSSLF